RRSRNDRLPRRAGLMIAAVSLVAGSAGAKVPRPANCGFVFMQFAHEISHHEDTKKGKRGTGTSYLYLITCHACNHRFPIIKYLTIFFVFLRDLCVLR